MMNTQVMMLVLASGLFSAMWSSDQPTVSGPRMIADRAQRPHRRSVLAVSTRSHSQVEPGGPNHTVDLSTADRTLRPVGAVPPRPRVPAETEGPTDSSIGWTASLFQNMASSGRPVATIRDEITHTWASAERGLGELSRRAVENGFTAIRAVWQQSWRRFRQAREVAVRARRTAHR